MGGVAMDIMTADVFVTSVTFSENTFELSFLENREQSEDCAMLRQMMVSLANDDRLQEAFRELQELLREVVDIGYDMIRNPRNPPSVRERMMQRRVLEQREVPE